MNEQMYSAKTSMQEQKKIEFCKYPGETFTHDEVEQLMEWAFNASRSTIKVFGRDATGFQKVPICKYKNFEAFCVTAMNKIYSNQ